MPEEEEVVDKDVEGAAKEVNKGHRSLYTRINQNLNWKEKPQEGNISEVTKARIGRIIVIG